MRKLRKGQTVDLPRPWGDTPMTYTLGDFYAAMYTSDGVLWDIALNRETAETMILEGYLAVCRHAADQYAMDVLSRAYADCWGTL